MSAKLKPFIIKSLDMEKEIRMLQNELRLAGEDSRTITGYAAVFNSASRDMGFTEYIDEGAFDGVLERSDVFAVLNHQPDKVLARWNKGVGSLKLSVDDRGLKYEFEAPHTDLGNAVLEFVKRNELTESSFAFVVEKDSWEKIDGAYVRHINRISSLHDVSPCWTAAYADTSVSCRSFEEFKAQEERKEAEEKAEEERLSEEKRQAEEAEKQAKLKEYYNSIREAYKEALKHADELNEKAGE